MSKEDKHLHDIEIPLCVKLQYSVKYSSPKNGEGIIVEYNIERVELIQR